MIYTPNTFPGVSFNSKEVADALNTAYRNQRRVRLFYGDGVKKEIWHETNEVLGRIGRSTSRMGTIKAPILLTSKRSSGGEHILKNNIIGMRYTDTKEWLYKTDWLDDALSRYHTFPICDNSPDKYRICGVGYNQGKERIDIDILHIKQANNLVAFLKGRRMTLY